MNRYCILIAWESGSGLLTTGDILIQSLISEWFYVVADREYPSLIKGGHACYRIQFSDQPITGMSKKNDLLLCVDRMGVKHYLSHLDDGGILVQWDERHHLVESIIQTIEKKELINIYLPERQTVFGIGGNLLMTNILMLGVTWRVLGLPYVSVEEEVTKRFKNKPAILKLDLKCLEIGYNHELSEQNSIKLSLKSGNNTTHTQVYDGNEAVALGAVQGGMMNYYAYPMSPSSSILTHMSKLAKNHDIIIKQGEDEISVVQMTLGSMHVGARSLCATSGGGFDLMTETVSLAALIETPLVIINVQRPWPATGLPTWTAQADLELAAYAGHGEYARMVYSISDPEHAYYGIAEAMNYAEIFQIPVIVLSDKTIAETNISLPTYDESKITIQRGITNGADVQSSSDRYSLDNPTSKRWLPGSSEHVYFANGDEHREDGTLTEDESECQEMFDRRRVRMENLANTLPKPKVFGPKIADISFVGWGSTKMAMTDVLTICADQGISANYLHYDIVFPIEKIGTKQFFENNKNIYLIEGNMTGQLGKLIEQMGLEFRNKLLKYNGRGFFIEEIMDFIKHNITN